MHRASMHISNQEVFAKFVPSGRLPIQKKTMIFKKKKKNKGGPKKITYML